MELFSTHFASLKFEVLGCQIRQVKDANYPDPNQLWMVPEGTMSHKVRPHVPIPMSHPFGEAVLTAMNGSSTAFRCSGHSSATQRRPGPHPHRQFFREKGVRAEWCSSALTSLAAAANTCIYGLIKIAAAFLSKKPAPGLTVWREKVCSSGP